MRNRTKILLLGLMTAVLTLAAVSTAGYWYYTPVQVIIAVGPENSPEYGFALRLSEVLTQTRSSLRLVVQSHPTAQQALARFARHEADLAILRTDERKIPPSARALAVLEHEAMLVIGPPHTKLSSLADLAGKKVVVIGRDGRNEAFLHRVMEQYKHDPRSLNVHTLPPGTIIETLLAAHGGADLVVLFLPLSRLATATEFEDLSRALKGFSVLAIDDAKALSRKIPGLYAETIEAGLLSGSPRIPDDDMDTVTLQKILVARAKLPETQVVELMRAVFENSRQLAMEKTFATRIDPPDTEKGALIAVHEGASQYVASEVKTFFDRYSDLIYIGMSVASVFGSASFALYGTVFRRRPILASARATELTALRDRIRIACADAAGLDAAEAEMEAILEDVLRGLDSGLISPRGLEAFRLAYDHAHHALVDARAALIRR